MTSKQKLPTRENVPNDDDVSAESKSGTVSTTVGHKATTKPAKAKNRRKTKKKLYRDLDF